MDRYAEPPEERNCVTGIREGQREKLLEALRNHGTAFSALARQFGVSAGLHITDATALVEILNAEDRGAPLTQAGLGHLVGLTTGATSSLLNRLEGAGHVRRQRDDADRRVVHLHATEGVDAMVDHFFAPLVDRLAAVMDAYRPEVLAQFEQFVTDVATAMTAYAAEVGAPTS
ncbi:MarR family transcriptional regulator [Actinoplanes sp. NPDC049265]|uniref:MarR family transcriptional regulator n=1 Tax=Actinoplanes sp. NPDC049265 TaxID=3363902 RepID=UPI00371F6637